MITALGNFYIKHRLFLWMKRDKASTMQPFWWKSVRIYDIDNDGFVSNGELYQVISWIRDQPQTGGWSILRRNISSDVKNAMGWPEITQQIFVHVNIKIKIFLWGDILFRPLSNWHGCQFDGGQNSRCWRWWWGTTWRTPSCSRSWTRRSCSTTRWKVFFISLTILSGALLSRSSLCVTSSIQYL